MKEGRSGMRTVLHVFNMDQTRHDLSCTCTGADAGKTKVSEIAERLGRRAAV